MGRARNYWSYSVGLGLVWAVVLVVIVAVRGMDRAHPIFYVFGGFCIAWLSGTIARYTYPPPQRWTTPSQQ